MKKLALILMLIASMGLMLTGCSSTKLSDSFDKDTVETTAKQVVDKLNSSDYDGVMAMFADSLKGSITKDQLSSAVDKTYGNAGAFKEYKSVTVIGQKIKSTGEDAAVAIVVAKYENQKVIFTLSFDTDMKLIGLYMK